MRVVDRAVKRDILNRIAFLKEFRIFNNTPQNKLETLLSNSKLISVNRGKAMYKVGDKPDGIYLIKEGSFEITRPSKINK